MLSDNERCWSSNLECACDLLGSILKKCICKNVNFKGVNTFPQGLVKKQLCMYVIL